MGFRDYDSIHMRMYLNGVVFITSLTLYVTYDYISRLTDASLVVLYMWLALTVVAFSTVYFHEHVVTTHIVHKPVTSHENVITVDSRNDIFMVNIPCGILAQITLGATILYLLGDNLLFRMWAMWIILGIMIIITLVIVPWPYMIRPMCRSSYSSNSSPVSSNATSLQSLSSSSPIGDTSQ
jgi:hypothetical protein